MSEFKYVKMTEDEKSALQRARERRFGEGRRLTLGCFARLLAEESREDT